MKLYPEDESGPQSTKKPVVVESYNEIVFPEPSEVFLARVQNHPAVNVPRLPAGLNLPSPGTFLSMLFLFLLVVVFKFLTLQIFSLSFPLFWCYFIAIADVSILRWPFKCTFISCFIVSLSLIREKPKTKLALIHWVIVC